uniref:Protein ALP1-like isoform X1 n=1 Tax=Tanacetum cinerariifolium TaxID=118510 RepID=A0A699HSH0_TANCI|nr:protein ALP1-like isoform X1 [Tanacetum cinerariifolium]
MKFLSLNIQGLAQKAKKDWVKELCVKNKVNFLALQETKMENMELFCVKTCWGNMAFDYVHSDYVGNSGGILCVWDPNAFCKSSVTMLDYFIMVRGVWRQNCKDFLIIVVYAPHDIKEKMMLWDYLTREIGRWKREVVVMGDFNEESPSDESNVMIRMMGKLKFLKTKIWEWNKTNILCRKNVKAQCKADLEAVEAKVKWAIEGDENSSFFHGMLNKKRNTLSIRGIMVDGIWIDDPNLVKREFLIHFSSIFSKPDNRRALIQMRFPKRLSLEQQVELESEVSNKEIRGQCGIAERIKLLARMDSLSGFIDDAVFVGQWCESNINILVHVLECFYRASGLRINMSKSKIIGLHVDSDKVKGADIKLGGLMFKWIWRFYTQDTSLWVRVIKAIYGEAGNMDAKFMRFKLGNGENDHFWEDRWIEGDTLKKRFPRVYTLELCREITVAMKVTQPCLAFSFQRSPRRGVEQKQFEEVVTLVHGVRLVPMSDRWTWTLVNSGESSVASVRKLIDDKTLSDFDSKTRWIKYVPIKVNVLAWKVKSDSLPTKFNVSRRGIPIDSIKCDICDTGAETSSQLFFSCCMVRQTVRLISRWWDISYAEFESYEDWLAWLVNLRLSSKNKLMLEGVFYVMWWHFPVEKVHLAIRQLAYGVNASFLDEYMQISERSSRLALDHFFQAVMEIYGLMFLRKPTVNDVEKLYPHHEEKHAFLGMLGSLDCTDWEWFGCPYAFKGQYVRRDHGSNPFIFLEAVVSQYLWIWRAFFGFAVSNNGINVLYQCPIFNDLKTGRAPEIPFVANGVTYPSGYYVVDVIYPELAPLVKTIREPADDDHKRILYKQKLESARKDVERAFGVLKKK